MFHWKIFVTFTTRVFCLKCKDILTRCRQYVGFLQLGGRRSSQSDSQWVMEPGSLPAGWDSAGKDPEEVDNSTGSGTLGPEGRNPV